MTITLSTLDALQTAVTSGRTIQLGAYRLPARTEALLEASARRGASVDVVLAREAVGDYDPGLAVENEATAARLVAAGARARLADGVHLKAAVVDGAAYLDDRNFAARGASNVVRDDDPADVARVRTALAGGAPETVSSPEALALDKAGALAAEVRAIGAAPPGRLEIETESFGYGPVSAALRARVAAGDEVDLLVQRSESASPREAAALAALAALGVRIRTAESVDKVAVAAAGSAGSAGASDAGVVPDAAWLGSANATYAGPGTRPQDDWGLTTHDPALIATLRDRADAAWAAGRPFDPAPGARA